MANDYESRYEDEETTKAEQPEQARDGEERYEDDYGVEPDEAYEEEDEDEETDPADEDPDDTAYFMKLFDYMTEILQNGGTVPLTTKKLVDTEQCLRILNDMKHNLPDGIQYGWKIHEEKERILDKAEQMAYVKVQNANTHAQSIKEEAYSDAKRIVDDAKQKADAMLADASARANAMVNNASNKARRMVNESDVMKRANAEAHQLLENARKEAYNRRLDAVKDAYHLFDALQKQTDGISAKLESKKKEMVGESEKI